MRRIPWLAVALLAGLLVVTLPLASARVAPQQQLGVGAYLPLVFQAPLPTPEPTLPPAPGDTAVPLTPTVMATVTQAPTATRDPALCAAEYPTVCIPPPPPDLNCSDIPYRRFTVLPPDRHRFDSDGDGVGCEGA